MSRLEDVLRTALAETPTPPTRSPDPLRAVERRVGRARMAAAGAALVVAAGVTAAVVVPLQTLGGGHPATMAVGPSASASPSGSPSPSVQVTPRAPATLVWSSGARAVAAGGGAAWALAADGRGGEVVARTDGTTRFAVPPDVTRLGAGGGLVWAWGGRHVAAVDPQRGAVATFTAPDEVKGVGVTAGSAWVSVPGHVLRLEPAATTLRQVSSTPVAGSGGSVVVTAGGQVWVQSDSRLVEVVPGSGGARVGSSVDWPAPVLGPAGGDELWSYDGRLVAVTPRLLTVGTSVAEGARVPLPGTPTAVAPAPDGGLYVAVGGSAAGLYHYSAAALHRGGGPGDELPGAGVADLAVDDAGAALFVTNGTVQRWLPRG